MNDDRRPPVPWRWTDELILVEGSDRPGLAEAAGSLEQALRERPDARLRDVGHTAARRLAGGGCRLAVVAGSNEDAARKLAHARQQLERDGCDRIRDRGGIFYFAEPLARTGKLAFMFPGEGSQYPWMLAPLCLHFPEVRRVMDLADRAFAGHPRGYLPSRFIYPRPAEADDGRSRLFAMDGAVEGVFAANLAVARLLERFAIEPDVIFGHSTGDYAALLVSGALAVADDEHLVEIVRRLNAVYEALGREDGMPRATLLAVGLGRRDRLDERIEASGGRLSVAIDNCPHQVVVCGAQEPIAELEQALRADGAVLERLPFERPYHTQAFAPVCAPLGKLFSSLPLRPPERPLWSCATAAPVPGEPDALRRLAVDQWMKPVRFRETVEALYDDGVRLFVEAGPRGGLSSFVTDTLRGRPHLAAGADLESAPGIRQLLFLLAQLFAHGVDLEVAPLFARRDCREIDLEGPATALPPLERLVSSLPSLHFGGEPPVPGGRNRPGSEIPPPALEPPPPTPADRSGPGPFPGRSPAPAGPTDWGMDERIIEELFRINELLLDSQKRVVLSYLGRSQAPAERWDGERKAALPASNLAAPAAVELALEPPGAPPEPPEPQTLAATEPEGSTGDEAETRHDGAPGVANVLLQLVAERTGYPPEMLSPDADLEADLGIDSIKRVEILGALRQKVATAPGLEDLSRLRTLGQIAAALEAAAGPEEHQPAGGNGTGHLAPTVAGRIRSLEPERRVVLHRRIELSEDLWLRDHTLGRAVSTNDPDLPALPVVMLTMAVEMAAQAASLLVPEGVVTAVRDVRARRFLALREEHLDLEIEAERTDDGGPVQVLLREVGPEETDGSSAASPLLTADVEIGPAYPDPGAPARVSLRGPRPSRFRPEDLYTRVMFHGPRLQGVESIESWAENGAEIDLRALPTEELFASEPAPRLLTEPLLLDAAGQVVGFWTAEHLPSGFVVFPFQVDEIRFFGPLAPPGARFRCRASIELSGESLVRASFDVVGEDGRPHLRVTGWQDKRIAIAEELFRFRFSPGDLVLSRPVDEDDGNGRVRLHFPDRLMETEGGAWREGLAHLTLSRGERRTWGALTRNGGNPTAWLLGRVAAKDAVRLHSAHTGGQLLRPADIEISGPVEGILEARSDELLGPLAVSVRAGAAEAEAAVVISRPNEPPASAGKVRGRSAAPAS